MSETKTSTKNMLETFIDAKKIEGRESRNILRKILISAKEGYQISISSGEVLIQAEIKDLTFSGACLILRNYPSSEPGSFALLKPKISIYVGKKLILPNINYTIAWEKISDTHLIGIKFLFSDTELKNEFLTNKNVPATFFFNDPVIPRRRIYSRLYSFNENGFVVKTSLTNKHLIPQLTVSGDLSCENSIPLEDCLITHIERQSGFLHIRFKIEEGKEFERFKRTYHSKFCFSLNESRKYGYKELGSQLSFFEINEKEAYEELVKLRILSYSSKNKLTQKSEHEMSKGYSKEGLLIGGYLNGQLVCSVELRLKQLGHIFLVEDKIQLETISKNVSELMEVNRLCIHPNLKRSDVLLTIFKEIHLYSLNNGCKHAIISTTKQLSKLYVRLGARDLNISYPHPYIDDETLLVFSLPPSVYRDMKDINPLLWEEVYGENHLFANSNGLLKENKMSLWKRLQLYCTSLLLKIK